MCYDIQGGMMRRTLKDTDKVLLFITIIFSLYGLLNLVTASSREAVTNMDESIYYYFYRHAIILIMSLIASLIVIKMPLKKYYNFLPLLFFGVLALNLLLVIQGNTTRGASNWIDIGFFNLQPSELAKPVLIVSLAFILEKFNKILQNDNVKHFKVILFILLTAIPLILIVFMQKDLGTASILLGIFAVMFLASNIKIKDKLKTIFIGIGLLIFCLLIFTLIKGNLLTEAQLSRFNYYNPCSNYTTTGYQVCNAFIAINKGSVFGVGIGKSSQKYSYIPEPHTDMVFSIISEENGLFGGTLIFILYLILLYRILRIARICNSIKGKYICIGVASYIFMHILINLGGLFGIIPLTGVPLPFLSYGGSFTLSLLISLAIVQRVYIESKRTKKGKNYA